MMYKLSIITLSIVLFVGCAEKQSIDIDKKPKYQVQKKPEPIVSNKGSLFSKKGPSLFADKKELQIGDIIKVNISFDDETETTIEKDSASTRTGGRNIGTFSSTNPDTQNTVDKLNSAIGIGFNTEGKATSKSNVNSTVEDKIESAISSIVEEVYQNGNYFIKGSRTSLIQGEKLTVKISGVIRPYDIDARDNSIESVKIANLKVLYEKDGEEIQITRRKWGTRLIDAIWPF